MPKISGRNIANNNNSSQRNNPNGNQSKFNDYESGIPGGMNKRKNK